MSELAIKQKIAAITPDGIRSVHILSDFDRTLTKPFVGGHRVPSLISLLRDGKHLSREYAQAAHTLFAKYHPIEMDLSVPPDKKRQAMQEWWGKHFNLLIKSGLQKSDLDDIAQNPLLELRDGAQDLLKRCAQLTLPVVIMSASGTGGYAISQYLKNNGVLFENMHIIANEYEWDASGRAIGFKKPIIHNMNKDETLVQDFPDAFAAVKDRPNVILLGDSIEDLHMASGFAAKTILSFGFADTQDANILHTYEQHFDSVLDHRASCEQITSAISRIVAAS